MTVASVVKTGFEKKEESRRLETWMRSDEKTSFNSYGQRMRWSEVRDYHMRHLVIAETDCEWGGLITLGDLRKANYRCEDEFTVQNGKLKCNQKPSCNGVFSAEKYWGHWYLRCEECNPLLTKCGKGTPPEKKNVFFRALPELPLLPPLPFRATCTSFSSVKDEYI